MKLDAAAAGDPLAPHLTLHHVSPVWMLRPAEVGAIG
jgi:hypothetical protein